MYTKEQVARRIDHAVLKQNTTNDDVIKGAGMCRARGVGCLCVRSADVALARSALKDSNTKVASVIGFPHGGTRPEVKALEAKLAIEDGAVELDMVMNVGTFLSGNREAVHQDIQAVVNVAKPRGVPVKVILETCYLALEQVADACRIAQIAGADFVKTSTGFADGGATPEAIDVMLKTAGGTMSVKASGGIRDWETAVGYLEQGCKRLGIGSTEAVLDGHKANGSY